MQLFTLFFCLGFTLLAETEGEGVEIPSAPPVGAALHITDEQDRLMAGQLNPEAEAKSHANALYAAAMLLLGDLAGNRYTALDQLRQVVALDPHCIDAQVKIANLLMQSGQFDAAFAQLQAAAQANPHSADIKSVLGYTQKMRGQTEEAFRLSTEALRQDNNQSVSMRVILELASDQHDLAGGVLHVEDILRANGSTATATAWIALARLYTEIARVDTHPPSLDALLKTLLIIYQQAEEKAPSDVETLNLLADTYKNLGRKEEALKVLRQAIVLEPFAVEIILRCAELENDLGNPAEAIRYYEQAYAINENLSGLRDKLGQLYLDNKRYPDAIRLLEDALADSPEDPALAINLGIAYEKAGQPEKAQACFERVFALTSCPPDAYLKLAFFQLTNSQIKEAGETLASAATHFPKSAKVRFYQAVQCRYAKNYDAALDNLNQARALATGSESGILDVNFYIESALTLNLAGKKDLVPGTLQEGLNLFPDSADLMNELAYFWADEGDHLPEALALSKHAVRLTPDNGPIEDTCGWVCYKMNHAQSALPYLQRAAILTNNDPVVLQHLGDAYLKLGRASDAIAAWHRALKNDPGNHDLAAKIDAALAQANDAHLR